MKNIISLLIGVFLSSNVFTQPPIDRYNSNLFSTISETTNILFSSNVPQPVPGGGFYESITGYPLNVDEFSTTPVNLYMNIFQPTGDTLSKRPLIIICFGGGFVTGSKDHWSIRLLAQELAKRGYVTSVIDYRLGMNIFDADLSKRAVYRGVQDGRSAVRFFKADAANANTYRVDPEQIYIGGHSAGAFVATHNAYLETEIERPASTYVWPQGCGLFDWNTCWCPDQGCLDCAGNNQSYSGHAKAIFSLAGAVGDTTYMEGNEDPKVVMFHSEDDETVPYVSGEPFGSLLWAVVGSDLPVVYGSSPMSDRAENIGLPKDFNTYTNRGHDVHEQTSSTLYTDIVPGISDWFFDELLKPNQHVMSGKTYVCNSTPEQIYEVTPDLASYYDWKIIGGSFVNMSNWDNQVTVIWDINAPNKSISMTPFSSLDAKGDEVALNITSASTFQNTWMLGSDTWSNDEGWTLGQLPESCHHVVIPNQTSEININVHPNISTTIKSLYIGTNATLTVQNPSQITVQD